MVESSGRYETILRRILQAGKVWGLKKGTEWATCADTELTGQCLPIWTSTEDAEQQAVGEWAEFIATEIELADWVGDWLPGLAAEEMSIAIFSNFEGAAEVFAPERMLEDLQNEMDFLRLAE